MCFGDGLNCNVGMLLTMFSILVEEVLASYGEHEIGHVVDTGRADTSAAYCAVTLGNECVSFLAAFGQIAPALSTGKKPAGNMLRHG